MHLALTIVALSAVGALAAMPGPYAPPAGEPGSTAIPYWSDGVDREEDPRILGWASAVTHFTRGPENITQPGGELASYGKPSDALGTSDGYFSENLNVVSLGDGGSITLTFPQPIGDGPGPDIAVFENGFSDTFLELAFVEVSSNGTTFHRFPSFSLTQTDTQVLGFGLLDTTYIHNLAGKYRAGFGTPFDLAELAGMEDLDISMITHVRIVDVVGSINPAYGTRDSEGRLINDPWLTNWEAGGFDLDAVAYLNVIPEPSVPLILGLGALVAGLQRKRRR